MLVYELKTKLMKRPIVFFIFLFFILCGYAQNNDIHYRVNHGIQKVDSRKEIHFPNILGYQTLKCDFHIHTIFSDGKVTPEVRINEAWREGLDVVAITDHTVPQLDHIKGDHNTAYEMAKPIADEKGITLIHATEYTKEEPVGHLNFLFIDDANQYADPTLDSQKALEMAAEKGAFIIYNHPGWPDKNSDLFDFQINLMNQGKIHAIEVINSKEFYPIALDYCYQYDITPFSTTDIHAPIQTVYDTENKFRNITLVFAKDKSEEAVREALFAKRTVACSGNLLMGKEEFLSELLKKSLIVSNYKSDGTWFSCEVKNISEMTYYLDGPNHTRITFPANRTIRLKDEWRNVNTIYQVSNTYITSQKHLEMPLYNLFADESETKMPYITQKVNLLEPDTKIEVYCPTSGAEVRYTLNGTEPTSSSPLYSAPLHLNESSLLSLKSFKQGMKPSRVFKRQIIFNVLHSGEKIKHHKNGVNYKYFEGNFQSVSEFECKGKVVGKGEADMPDISVAKAVDHFGLVFTGYIYAPLNGNYNFETQSDDGSTLKISGVDLIDNDGSHSLTKVNATIPLKKGYHPFEIRYMEDYGGQELNVLWTIPNGKKERMEAKYFFIKNR